MIKEETIKASILGFAIADAIGVPVEFVSRYELKISPVTKMREGGIWNQPIGTWSDDTSMTIATMESISRLQKIDYTDIMTNFARWYTKGEFTANDYCFDTGMATRQAISNFAHGVPALDCGLSGERNNGNGSLMRILPIAFYLFNHYGNSFDDEAMNTIHNVSSLTHAHPRSLIACGIYCLIVAELLSGQDITSAVKIGLSKAKSHYEGLPILDDELKFYSRLFDDNFANLPENEIKSSGYVVHTLEAVIWCLLNTSDYKSLVLKAVNLGDDTDTVAAIAGGLAGIIYGLENIPSEWLSVLKKRDYLEDICVSFCNFLQK